jgi:hypothetical protein
MTVIGLQGSGSATGLLQRGRRNLLGCQISIASISDEIRGVLWILREPGTPNTGPGSLESALDHHCAS